MRFDYGAEGHRLFMITGSFDGSMYLMTTTFPDREDWGKTALAGASTKIAMPSAQRKVMPYQVYVGSSACVRRRVLAPCWLGLLKAVVPKLLGFLSVFKLSLLRHFNSRTYTSPLSTALVRPRTFGCVAANFWEGTWDEYSIYTIQKTPNHL